MAEGNSPPAIATGAVLVKSEPLPEGTPTVRGYDFNEGIDYHKLLNTYAQSGFQASNFGLAVKEINKMVGVTLILYWCNKRLKIIMYGYDAHK